jgi:hypothetical protein
MKRSIVLQRAKVVRRSRHNDIELMALQCTYGVVDSCALQSHGLALFHCGYFSSLPSFFSDHTRRRRKMAAAFLCYMYSERVVEATVKATVSSACKYALETVALFADCFGFLGTHQSLAHPLCSQHAHQHGSLCRTIKKTMSAAMMTYAYGSTF